MVPAARIPAEGVLSSLDLFTFGNPWNFPIPNRDQAAEAAACSPLEAVLGKVSGLSSWRGPSWNFNNMKGIEISLRGFLTGTQIGLLVLESDFSDFQWLCCASGETTSNWEQAEFYICSFFLSPWQLIPSWFRSLCPIPEVSPNAFIYLLC